MTASTSCALHGDGVVIPADAVPRPAGPVDAAPLTELPVDPLPLPVPGWGAEQARDAVAEAALVLPGLAGSAELVRAVSTVVFRVGALAVKVHPPGTDPDHLARVHSVLAASPVTLTCLDAPVVTSHGVVTVTAWTPPSASVGWGAVGEALRALHDLPTAAQLPPWRPLRRLPAQLVELPSAAARALLERRATLLDRLADLAPVLPLGAVHGDIAPDNVLSTASGPRWIDLDFTCAGLREYDLAAVVRRRGAGQVSGREYRAFVRGYGVDLRGWPGLALLDDMCTLSALGFRLWTDRCAGRPSDWLLGALGGLSPARAGR